MYEYKFVKVELSSWGLVAKPKEDYHEIVYQYARDGWRLMQIFAPPVYGNGSARYFELVFERKTDFI
jgi:hypothetical protein